MIWALFLIVVLTLVVAAAVERGALGRKKTRIEQRVEAYKQTIRRTNTPPRYDEMNDTELSDILTAAAQKLNSARQRRMSVLLGAGATTLAVSIFIGLEHGLQAFGVAFVVGLLVTYGINRVLERRTRDWFNQNDLNAERLAVD